jgi:CBS-domain-containing membrane protein
MWNEAIKTVKVKDLLRARNSKLITIDHNTKLGEAMKLLQDADILSAPVVDLFKKEFLGFIDVLDIAGFVLAKWKHISVHLDNFHFPTDSLFTSRVEEVLNFSMYDNPSFISEDSTVEQLIKLFLDPKYYFRLHRAAVIDAKGEVVDVVSQSDVIVFASKHLNDMAPNKTNQPVGLVSGLIRSPIMVRIDTSFADALELLYKNRISGLALVDHEFKLSGNLSASDLRGMNSMGYDFFTGSVLQFLAKGTNSKQHITTSVRPANTFGDVIGILASERIHRVYICDDYGHPLGFVTLIDVIARLM